MMVCIFQILVITSLSFISFKIWATLFSLDNSGYRPINFIFSKDQLLFLSASLTLFGLHSIYFRSHPYHSLPSATFGLWTSFPDLLSGKLGSLFESLFCLFVSLRRADWS